MPPASSLSEPQPDPAAGVLSVLSSPVLNVLVGLAGIVIPIVAWANSQAALTSILLGVETVLLLGMVANHLWLRRAYIQLRRANSRVMSDPAYFELIRTHLESELISDFGDIASGHMQVYGSEVPRLSVLLLRSMLDSKTPNKRVLTTDLTTNPNLLTTRREYLAANRRVIEAGGTIQRAFICWQKDLIDPDFSRALLHLIDHHRGLGVQCGMAVRDRLRAEQAVDFIVVSSAAVLVEEDQGDSDYVRGRSSVYFRSVERWIGRFESIWGHGSESAAATLAAYETLARPMLAAGIWDLAQAEECVSSL